MTLPYSRMPEALRPSMFLKLESDPLDGYLTYLGPEEFKPKWDASVQMAAGTVMHAYAEAALTGKPLEYEIKGLSATDTKRAEGYGRLMWWQYRCSGALELLRARGVEAVEHEIPEGAVIPGTDVPLGGRIDVLLAGNVVHDFKTSGVGNVGASDPKQGYALALNGKARPRAEVEVDGGGVQHRAYGMPLEDIYPRWADQLAMYSWGVGWKAFSPIRVSVHQIVCGVGVYVFDAVVSTAHQLALRDRCVNVWEAIQEERIVPEAIAAGGVQRVRECA